MKREDRLDAKNWNLLKLQRYQQQSSEVLVRLGTKTWETVKFRGTLYDHDTPVNEFLKVYAAQYDSVEYLHSFNDSTSLRRIKELKAEVESINKDFRFCPTIPRRISHEFPLGETPYDLTEFIEKMDHLGEHLGPFILRLPEKFSPSCRGLLLKFLDKCWPSNRPVAINLTHDEWYRNKVALKELVKEIRGSNASILVEDRIERPFPLEHLAISDHLIVRFFGRPALGQDEQRLALWVYKLGELQGFGIRDSHFFLYEQEEMCLSLLRKTATELGGSVRIPAGHDVSQRQLGFSF